MRLTAAAAFFTLAVAVAVDAPGQAVYETLEVRVINVDVVVTARDGAPVRGLAAGDFELLEDGKRQLISNFYAVDAGTPVRLAGEASAEPLARSRAFLIFFDLRHMASVVRSQVIDSAVRFVETRLTAGDQVSVASWNGELRIEVPLTDDVGKLAAAIRGIENRATSHAARSDFAALQRDCQRSLKLALDARFPIRTAYAECIESVRAETLRSLPAARQLMNAMKLAITTLAGVEARSVFIALGEGLPFDPGAENFEVAHAIFSPYGFNATREGPSLGEKRRHQALLDEIVKTANTYGVTFYAIAAPSTTNLHDIRNPTANLIGAADFARMANGEEGFKYVAELTGGIAVKRAIQFDAAIDRVAADLDSYYSLGYHPSSSGRADRKIVIRTKDRSHTVRARRTHMLQSVDETMSSLTKGNIYSPVVRSDIDFAVEIGEPQRNGATFDVPIEVVLRSPLTLLPVSSALEGSFTVYVAVGTARGALSPVFRKANPVRIAADEEESFRSSPVRFTSTLTVRPGDNLLSVGVRDDLSGATGFTRSTIYAGPNRAVPDVQ